VSEDADEADALADLVNRWSVRRMDPAQFHVDRDQIAKRLRRLAARLRVLEGVRQPSTTWRPDACRPGAMVPLGSRKGAAERVRSPARLLADRGKLT
jgi:hypothetical protein